MSVVGKEMNYRTNGADVVEKPKITPRFKTLLNVCDISWLYPNKLM